MEPEPGEPQTRAAMLELPGPFRRAQFETALNRLADTGWNSVILPCFLDGYPIFPTQVWADYGLRRRHPAFRKWDPFEVAFDLAWRRGLDILVACAPYLAGPVGRLRKPPLMRHHPEWVARPHPNRRMRRLVAPRYHYYCPVNREYRRFISDTLFVLHEAYPFHGLLVDLRHYPFYAGGENHLVLWCYCESCRREVMRDLGFDPAGVEPGREQTMIERWQEWQAAQMDLALGYIRARALKARSTMRILGLLTTDSGLDNQGYRPLIHWKTWVERSLVEALVLDGYSAERESFAAQLSADLKALPRTSLLLPMLPRKVSDGAAFLPILRQAPIPGFVTRFEDWHKADFDPTARVRFDTKAFPVESDPIRSICVLFDNMRRAAPQEEEFAAFLEDLSYILTRKDPPLTISRLMVVAENIRGLRERVRQGRLNFGQEQDRVLHDLDLAGRLAYLAGCDLVE